MMRKTMNVIEQYLQRYAESEVTCPALTRMRFYDAVLVVPVYRESTAFLDTLIQQTFQGVQHLLLIVVSNHPDDLPQDARATALSSHQNWLNRLSEPQWVEQNLSLHERAAVDTIVIDKTAVAALPRKQGVGLARKVGADVALRLWSLGKISIPWIFCTDADALLPLDYFSGAEPKDLTKGISALTYPFSHRGETPQLEKIIDIYDAKLRAYVAGLVAAGSPYAFHTIGSTIAINPQSYAEVRGFPKRSAGEDFYILNKLAKTGRVERPATGPISLDARLSDRVPFGTGPAMLKLKNENDPEAVAVFYHPMVFSCLALFLTSMPSFASIPESEPYGKHVNAAAQQVGIEQFQRHVEKQRLVGDACQAHFNIWFDAFRTLKFIHALRDMAYPSLSYREWKAYEKNNL